MKDIIIVGSGKAALLHYNSYKKLKNKVKIYFTDIKNFSNYITNNKLYSTIQECIKSNDLKINNLIVDICTPKSEFLKIIKNCKSLGIKDVLVEKPFVIDNKTLMKLDNMNIVMVENYLFSKLTQMIKKYLDENNKKVDLIYTNFSKNRISESIARRGYNTEVTLNYEIEIPHQIYLTQYFLNNPNSIQNDITCSRDLKIGDVSLENHGYGLIISRYNDIDIIYESNLTSVITQKRIIIRTKDGYTVEGNYAIYSKDLKLIKPANMSIYYNGKIMYSEFIEEDDNFTYFIDAAYSYFNKEANNPDLVDINTFSNIMYLYCNNLLERKNIKTSG